VFLLPTTDGATYIFWGRQPRLVGYELMERHILGPATTFGGLRTDGTTYFGAGNKKTLGGYTSDVNTTRQPSIFRQRLYFQSHSKYSTRLAAND